MPIRVLQIQGQWLNLDPGDQARMPSAINPKGRNNQLGVDMVIGARVWDVQSKFRLRLGPLSWRQFCSIMPNGVNLLRLCQMARTFVGPELDFDVQPVPKPEEVPPCRLSREEEDGFYLGWNIWLQSQPLDRQVDDAVFVRQRHLIPLKCGEGGRLQPCWSFSDYVTSVFHDNCVSIINGGGFRTTQDLKGRTIPQAGGSAQRTEALVVELKMW